MTKLKLTYFDFDGIRGEAVRMALNVSNVNPNPQTHTQKIRFSKFVDFFDKRRRARRPYSV